MAKKFPSHALCLSPHTKLNSSQHFTWYVIAPRARSALVDLRTLGGVVDERRHVGVVIVVFNLVATFAVVALLRRAHKEPSTS